MKNHFYEEEDIYPHFRELLTLQLLSCLVVQYQFLVVNMTYVSVRDMEHSFISTAYRFLQNRKHFITHQALINTLHD